MYAPPNTLNKWAFILNHSGLVVHSKSIALTFYTNKSIFFPINPFVIYDYVDKHLFAIYPNKP